MFQNFIGGEWVDGGRTQDNINPSDTGDIIGQYAVANQDQATAAITAAEAAFGQLVINDAAATRGRPRSHRLGNPGASDRAWRSAGA